MGEKKPKMLHCVKCTAFILGKEKKRNNISSYNFQMSYGTCTEEHIKMGDIPYWIEYLKFSCFFFFVLG